MPRNEPCWCGSGVKWKKCHKDRESQVPPPYARRVHEMRSSELKGYCNHPDAPNNCSSTLVRAHTIQRSGGLSAIAEGGHVLSVRGGASHVHVNGGLIVPQRLGLRIASTFDGFCKNHDESLFRPIENQEAQLDSETSFLLSFRALSFEILSKRNALASLPVQKKLDVGRVFVDQAEIQLHLHATELGMKRGLENSLRWKDTYDDIYRSGVYNAVKHYSVLFDRLLPIAGAGGFNPEFDFFGTELQRLSRGDNDYEIVTLTVFPLGKRTAAVFAWMGVVDGPAQSFVSSFARLADAEKANAVVHALLEYIENAFLTPSWWQSLGKDKTAACYARFAGGTAARGYVRQSTDLVYRDPTLVDGEVITITSSIAL